MKRATFFDRLRFLKPDGRFLPAEVQDLDKLADELGISRIDGVLTPSKAAVDLIKRFEGCRLQAYPDPGSGGDPWTIGWGSTGPGIRRGVSWTQEMANARLESDVAAFGDRVWQLVKDTPTTQNQFDALVSFAYNVGVKALADSTLLKRHREGSFAGAALEFARWNKAAGKVLSGLVTRRAAEAALYRGQPE